ncbi:septum formation family protein [Herbiconiux sp. CPCC 205763]|uniref:Septum formation family protein n=1 Tax=Herbiconiux aconitum TaxID=2970913 RepID=A0ABT2GRJ4_9MICO|nr:septum formation family protein [Herbiconiux aconitum]MCS5718843.1 septum formation family protein [Herbiconiux aconitum]
MSSGDYGWGASESGRGRRDDRYFGRGLAYSLLVVPIAVPVWLIIWQSGWISGIVAFGTAFGAAALFRYGAKGRVSTRGAVAISIVSFVTILLCVASSLLFDASVVYAPEERMFGGLAEPGFWSWLTGSYLSDPAVAAALAWSAALSLFLAALGALPTLIGLLRGRTAGARWATLFAPIGIAVTAVAVLGLLTANGYGGGVGPGGPGGVGGGLAGVAGSPGSGGGAASGAQAPASFDPAFPVGSCLLGVSASGDVDHELTPPAVVPCEQAHDAEVVFVGETDASAGPDYPGASWLSDAAAAQCTATVSEFLGVAWDQSGFTLQTVYPSEGSWGAGDRALSCWVQNPSAQTTGSLRGVGAVGAAA